MAKFQISGPDVKKILKKAKSKPVAFAFSTGKTDEDNYFAMNRLKPSEVLWKEAKGMTGNKAAAGMSFVDGKEFQLTCEHVIPGLAKKMKKHLKREKVMLNVIVMDAKGNVLESDIEELEDDPELEGDDLAEDDEEDEGLNAAEEADEDIDEDDMAPTNATEEAEEDEGGGVDERRKAWLGDRLKALVPEARKFASVNPTGGPRVIEALKSTPVALGKDQLDKAEKVIEGLEKLLKVAPMPMAPEPPKPEGAQPGTPPSEEDLARLRQQINQHFAALGDDLKTFLKRGEPSLSGKAKQLAQAFATEIKGTDLKKAALLVTTLKNYLAAHLPNLPLKSEAEKAAEAIAAAVPVPAARYEQAAALQGKYAKGSKAARDAFDGYAAVLGDQPVTPALLKTAKEEISTIRTEFAAPQERLEKAMALPDGEEKGRLIEAAKADIARVQTRLDNAIAFEKAARGKAALTKALEHGPLSAESGRSLPDATAEALINAFVRAPEFAADALEMAGTATHPVVIAQGLPVLLDLKDGGFAHGDQRMAPDKAEQYAKDLLKMGGNVGADYFDRMPGYMAKGRQFDVDPLGDSKLKDQASRAQKRSVKLASVMIGDDGTIKTDGKRLNNRVNQMLFNPTSLEHPMPAMNEYTLKTLKMFEDPKIAEKAGKILGKLPDAPTGGSATLVKTALRKSSNSMVSKKDMQTAVMASMLKSLDQGPVGSCFSTAPARRVRETDPMSAMEAYAQIASTGKLKPPNGLEVPVVTSIHKGEDPIMRSWEYTLASSAAKAKGSMERTDYEQVVEGSIDDLAEGMTQILFDKALNKDGFFKTLGMGVKAAATHKGRTKQLKKLVSSEFDFVYDPVGDSGPASDGKSTDGRYIMTRRSTGRELRSEDDFVDEVLDIALTVFGIDPGSTEAGEVRALIESDAFLNPIRNHSDQPWELSPGGDTEALTQTLLGKKVKQVGLVPEGDGTEDESERTKQVFTALLGEFVGSKDEMQTIRTVGQHGFNGLPQDPSLAKLLEEGKDKIAENMQTHLLDKGTELARTTLPVARAQYLYDEMIAEVIRTAPDQDNIHLLQRDAPTNRPTADMTPKQISDVFELACKAYLEREALDYSNPDTKVIELKARAKGMGNGIVLHDLGAPEFTIADTNWGDSESHTYFVIAPDPSTGAPIMWEKAIPPGKLKPAGRDWMENEWARIK